ncbi:MAG TPA: zf-HC2 domain-containing protein [Pyrinomonadaceae bacterium]|jgi:anti-sigma factor RsiW|nr:zf-HC2 domain-containing protein [Pyrinomonadaceae bacterium]
MLCADFEDRLTDYLDGALAGDTQRAFSEHALRCPVCHELLSEVKNTVLECRAADVPAPSVELEARILLQTAPESAMTCGEFEDHLTDYLDGFLPAPLYHRWERHAALCSRCSDLPGEVVRSIGACYSYISEERPFPAYLHDRILQATLGTTEARKVRAPLSARLTDWLRGWLDTVVSPQLATVATMVLLAVFVGTSTISPDGSISGLYNATLRLAAQTYVHGANTARSAAQSDELKRVADAVVGEESAAGGGVNQSETPKQPAEKQDKP